GKTWGKINNNKGFPEGIIGIIGVTVSPVNSDRVWAIIENKEKGGVYRSDDAGKTWSYLNDSRSLRQRAWYYSKIYADTEDINGVYIMNVRYHHSTDGGKTFKANNAPHGDHHDLWIAPEDNQRMIIADDGGAQVTYDGGKSWSTYYNQPTAQYYRVTTDNAFPYRIYVAQQDNSTQRVGHRSFGRYITENDWEPTAGSESAHIAVDPINNEIAYGGNYLGFLNRLNHDTKSSRPINVWPENTLGDGVEKMKYRFQWNFPIVFSKHNPKKLYTFSNHVHVTENEGQGWELISPDLTRNDPSKLQSSGGPITKDNTGVEYYATIFAVDESPLKEGLIWVGSDDGLIHITKDGGESWENITPRGMPEWMMINSIDASPFDEGTAYVAGTRYKLGDFTPYLYRTDNYGKSWKLITDGIESEHFTRVVRSDKTKKGLLYSGTETGIYISFNDGKSWEKFQKNLPIVPITDLTIKDNSLIVATQGRSLWIIDDLTVLHQLDKNDSELKLYTPKDVYRVRGSGGNKSLTAGTNLPNGVIVHYYIPGFDKEKDEITLSFHSKDGEEIKSYGTKDKENKLEVKKGGNNFVWDMRHQGAEVLEGMILWAVNFSGAKAIPGEYIVKLKHNDKEVSKPFNIIQSPISEALIEDMQLQFEFINEINSMVDNAHKSI
ncbi:MAG: glycosyl hydrolase, partial [Flavobacteriaceae bacterium]